MPTACSRPETAPEIPRAAKSMPDPALLTPPIELFEQRHEAVHPLGDFVDGFERGQGRGGKPEDRARETDHRFQERRRFHTLIMGRTGPSVQFLDAGMRVSSVGLNGRPGVRCSTGRRSAIWWRRVLTVD